MHAECGVSTMEGGVAYLFAIIAIVLVLNFYFMFVRMRSGNKRKKMNRAAVDEAKQALWREKEVARRIEREQDDALERVKLRNETLALYEEVRRRHAKKDELERLGLDSYANVDELDSSDIGSYINDDELNSVGLDTYPAESEPDDSELDPFDVFKKNK